MTPAQRISAAQVLLKHLSKQNYARDLRRLYLPPCDELGGVYSPAGRLRQEREYEAATQGHQLIDNYLATLANRFGIKYVQGAADKGASGGINWIPGGGNAGDGQPTVADDGASPTNLDSNRSIEVKSWDKYTGGDVGWAALDKFGKFAWGVGEKTHVPSKPKPDAVDMTVVRAILGVASPDPVITVGDIFSGSIAAGLASPAIANQIFGGPLGGVANAIKAAVLDALAGIAQANTIAATGDATTTAAIAIGSSIGGPAAGFTAPIAAAIASALAAQARADASAAAELGGASLGGAASSAIDGIIPGGSPIAGIVAGVVGAAVAGAGSGSGSAGGGSGTGGSGGTGTGGSDGGSGSGDNGKTDTGGKGGAGKGDPKSAPSEPLAGEAVSSPDTAMADSPSDSPIDSSGGGGWLNRLPQDVARALLVHGLGPKGYDPGGDYGSSHLPAGVHGPKNPASAGLTPAPDTDGDPNSGNGVPGLKRPDNMPVPDDVGGPHGPATRVADRIRIAQTIVSLLAQIR